MAAKKDALLSDAKYFIGFGVTNFVSCMLTLITLVGEECSKPFMAMIISLLAISILIVCFWLGYCFYRKSQESGE